MFKNDKNAILLRHWTFARSPSLKQTNSRTNVFSQSSFPKGGERTTAHLQQNNTHARAHTHKNLKNSPMSPSPETQKLNQSIRHYSRAILLPQSRKEPRGKGCGTRPQLWSWGPRTGDGDLSLTLLAVWPKLSWQARLELAVKLHIFHVNIQGSCLSLGCVISCVAIIIY